MGMVTIPVVLYCVFRVLEIENAKLQHSRCASSIVRIIVVMGAVSVALFVPFFLEVLAVVSTALLVTLQMFLPVALTYALSRHGVVRFALCEFLLLLLGLCTFFIGMSTALNN